MWHGQRRRWTARTCAIAAFPALFAIPGAAGAQRAARDTAVSISLAAALSAAEARAPDRLVAAARVAVAHADVAVAGMPANPTVLAGGGLNTAHFYTALSLPIPLFGQLGAARAVAEALEIASRRDLDVTRLDVAFATSIAWVDVWLAEREAGVAAQASRNADQLAAATEQRVQAGAAPRFDAVRAHAEAVRLGAEAESAVLAQLSTGARLAWWLDTDPNRELRALGNPPAPHDVPTLGASVPRLERHPLLLAARGRTTAAEATVALERRRRWPWVAFELGAGLFDPAMANVPGVPAPIFADAHVSIAFEVPMVHLHGPLIARAQAGVAQSAMELQAVRRRLRAELAVVLAEFRASVARARAQRESVLPSAQEAADLALDAYRAGRADLQSVIASQQALAEARRAAYRADADLARSSAAVAHAMGGPL